MFNYGECNFKCFNTQPPEGGWDKLLANSMIIGVSTHSRLKAAGNSIRAIAKDIGVSTHSRLKAAGTICVCVIACQHVSTHSRLKAAGVYARAKATAIEFQHTAA